MKLSHLIALTFLLIGSNSNAQPKSDIGIRYSGTNLNLFQIEFRKPVNEFYSFRFSITKGRLFSSTSSTSILFHSDTLVVFRDRYQHTNSPVDIRFGIERKLKWNLFSVHSDLVVGYYNLHEAASTRFRITDEYGFMYEPTNYSSEVPTEYLTPYYGSNSWRTQYISGGLALGLSLDVPFYDFILGINAQYTGTIGLPVESKSLQNPANGFEKIGEIQYRHYPSAGVALRYVLGNKNKD